MLAVGTIGKLNGVPCKVTPHIQNYMPGKAGSVITHQLLEFDTFTGWNWQGSTAPSTAIIYGLNIHKYYHWHDPNASGFVPDVETIPDTLRSVAIPSVKLGCNCIQCHDENKLAEPNMTGRRFMCFSCRSTDKWRYEGQFI